MDEELEIDLSEVEVDGEDDGSLFTSLPGRGPEDGDDNGGKGFADDEGEGEGDATGANTAAGADDIEARIAAAVEARLAAQASDPRIQQMRTQQDALVEAHLETQKHAALQHLERLKVDRKTARETQAWDVLDQIEERMAQAKAAADKFGAAIEQVKTQREEDDKQFSQPAAAATPKFPKADAWIQKHPDFNTPKAEGFRKRADAISKEISAEGIMPTHDLHYTTLDERLRKEFPERFKGQPSTKQKAPGTAGAAADRVAPGGATGKIKLPKALIEGARAANLDLSDKALVKRLYTNWKNSEKKGK